MAEVKDLEQATPATEPAAAAEAAPKGGWAAKWKDMPKKKRRRLIRRIIVLVIVIAAAVGAWWFFLRDKQPEAQVVTDVVSYGSITSTVEGSGLTKAKKSETITLTTAGTVQDVLVTEGQQVTAGTPLFTVDSEAARTAVEKARKDVEGYEKQLRSLQKDIAVLNLAQPRRYHHQGPEGGRAGG